MGGLNLGLLASKLARAVQRKRDRSASGAGGDTEGTDGIAVSYAPERDGDADPGEVVWTWVPYEDDPSQGKDRPVLVLGHDGPLLAGVQLSSQDHDGRRDEHDWVPVGSGAWDRQGRPSFADASRLLRFAPSAVRREGAALPRERFEAVLQRVEQIHDWHH
ncbi:MAG: type II toxin-antitoxin system PemK/MazF family toxin [Actinobacteria bacterium]|nr:type II toxin-antitoxin system PemK/MazF family toxin [Actinomycetota bacterium]